MLGRQGEAGYAFGQLLQVNPHSQPMGSGLSQVSMSFTHSTCRLLLTPRLSARNWCLAPSIHVEK